VTHVTRSSGRIAGFPTRDPADNGRSLQDCRLPGERVARLLEGRAAEAAR
jgi:hypothetical protein